MESNRKQKSINVSGVMSEEGTKCPEMQLCDSLSGLPLPTGEYYINKKTKGAGNIRSLTMLTNEFDVEMNYAVSNAFYVYNHNGDFLVFKRCPYTNMYRLDVQVAEKSKIDVKVITVDNNKKEYSTLECKRVEKVQDLQHLLGCPSDLDLAHAIEHNVIGNNNYSRKDVRIATKIFGKDQVGLKSKSVKRKSRLKREDDILEHSPEMRKHFKDITTGKKRGSPC